MAIPPRDIPSRRRLLGMLSGTAVVAGLGGWGGVASAATLPLPVRPRIQRRTTVLRIGYFGDSTTRGAWATGLPAPNEYAYNDLTPVIADALADLGSVEVYSRGNDAIAGFRLLYGGQILPNGPSVAPFSQRLTEVPYDAVVVGVGICDALLGQTPAQFAATLAGLQAAAVNAGTVLLFETPNPITGSTASALLESYRALFAGYDLLIDQNVATAMSDTFHPTPAAYVVKARRVAGVLRDNLIRRYLPIDV